MTTKTLSKGNLRVVLDKSQVFPDDPGQGTPAMVYCGEFSATYWCAVGESELFHDRRGAKRLTDEQVEWLESLDSELSSFLYGSSNDQSTA